MVSGKGFCDLGFAKVDIDRPRRRGYPEAVYCLCKESAEIKAILRQLIKHKQDALLTKLTRDKFNSLKRAFPALKYNISAKIGFFSRKKSAHRKGAVMVISAGTSDIPVAEEASVTAEFMGSCVWRCYDAGVAGVHRLMHNMPMITKAKVIIVVAGMEGALSSLVSGLVSCPVIAVPTSVGYGASFNGLSALLTMLNGCSPGVTVVNIDNGFGAGYFASLINK